MIATTYEQSQRLLACGVSPDTADMYLEKCRLPEAGDFYLHTVHFGIDAADWFSARMNKDITPAWSLSALLDLFPERIFDGHKWYYCQLCPEDLGYTFRYYAFLGDAFTTFQIDPISACVKGIEWLAANGFKFNTSSATHKNRFNNMIRIDNRKLSAAEIDMIREEYRNAVRNRELFRLYPKIHSANNAVIMLMHRMFGTEIFKNLQ